MFRITASKGMLLAACLAVGSLAMAADPSIDQMGKAANSGMFPEANSPVARVLRDHPQSGKEHRVQAGLLAEQGRLPAGRTELSTAERLAPGLPYAKPGVPGPSNQGAGGQLLWKLILAAIGVLIAGHLVFRRPSASTVVPYAMAGGASTSRSDVPAPKGSGMADAPSWDAPGPSLEGGGKWK